MHDPDFYEWGEENTHNLKIDYIDPNGAQLLAGAIVATAAKDYLSAARITSDGRRAMPGEAKAIERFVRSEYFATISDTDPKWLMDTLNRQVNEEAERIGRRLREDENEAD